MSNRIRMIVAVALLSVSSAVFPQAPAVPPQQGAPAQPAAPDTMMRLNRPAVISLSPAVITEKAKPGQSFTETLTLVNDTPSEYAYQMVAQDVVVTNGERKFVNAGDRSGSIAQTAVFTPDSGVIKPHSSESVQVRLTVPPNTDLRAVVTIFRNSEKLALQKNSVGLTGSLGALITFNLADSSRVEASAPVLKIGEDRSVLSIEQTLTNVGTEPVIPSGVAAVLDNSGKLVAKVALQQQRLLPGERVVFKGEHPGQLRPGVYKVVCSFDVAGQQATSSGTLKIE